jgi:hypothetical protein
MFRSALLLNVFFGAGGISGTPVLAHRRSHFGLIRPQRGTRQAFTETAAVHAPAQDAAVRFLAAASEAFLARAERSAAVYVCREVFVIVRCFMKYTPFAFHHHVGAGTLPGAPTTW